MAESPKMQRKDRLLALITCLRDGELYRAKDLAHKFDVSQRTLYRDMETLMRSGVPVKGERGTGYYMTAPITLPPLNLTMQELEALHLGLAVMTQASDPDLRSGAKSLAAKIDTVLPEDGTVDAMGWGLAVFPFADTAIGVHHIPALRQAVRTKQKLHLTYTNARNIPVTSTVHPLKLEFWGRLWTLAFWCETRQEPQSIRVDRITNLTELPLNFSENGIQ